MRILKFFVILLTLCVVSTSAMAYEDYIVTTDVLNVYAEPDENSDLLTQYHKDDGIVGVDTLANGWLKIQEYDRSGYVKLDGVMLVDDSPKDLVGIFQAWLADRGLILPATHDMIFTLLLLSLVVVLFFICKRIHLSDKPQPKLRAIGHVIAIIISLGAIWQMLTPCDSGLFSNHFLWFFGDHSWIRKGIYFIIFCIAIIFLFSSVRTLYSKENSPAYAAKLWAYGILSWPVFLIFALIINSVAPSMKMDIFVSIFILIQLLFVSGMLIYYIRHGQYMWPLLLIISYILVNFTLILFMMVAILLIIAIILCLLIGFFCLSQITRVPLTLYFRNGFFYTADLSMRFVLNSDGKLTRDN